MTTYRASERLSAVVLEAAFQFQEPSPASGANGGLFSGDRSIFIRPHKQRTPRCVSRMELEVVEFESHRHRRRRRESSLDTSLYGRNQGGV
jgi:hypothetical protein